MKRYFGLFILLGLWVICASACGKEEAVEAEGLGAGNGRASLEVGSSQESEGGTEAAKGQGTSGEGQEDPERAKDSEAESEEGNAQGRGEPEGTGDGTADSGSVSGKENGTGKDGAGKETAGLEGEADEKGGAASEGKNGTGKETAASEGKDGAAPDAGAGKSDAVLGGKEGGGSQNGALQTAALGALSVEGTKLVDDNGNGVLLKGISTHGLAWYPDYVNEDCIRQLKEEWGANVFRLAMYTAEYGGFCSGGDKESLKALVKDGVKYATDNDMYVIIDWHILSDGNPNTYLEDAKGFFEEMSEEYADYTNVLYEICNEPNGGTSWSDVKSYAEEVIEVIRENDEDGIILVGTPNWSQYVEQAAADPIEGYDNVMYTLHFYAATHKEDLREAMVRAVEAGLPIFVSEYGICDASGNGGIDEYQANQWVELLNQYQISYVAWNLSNKSETSAVIKSSCSKTSGFTLEDLSDSGKWLYNMLGAQGSLGAEASGSGTGQEPAGDSAGGQQGSASGSGTGQEPAGGSAGGQQGSASGSTGQGGTLTQGELSLSVQPVNSWGQGGEAFCQYTLTITNLGETDLEGWTVEVTFNGDIALSNGWNGNYQVSGSTLVITSMDYNGHIDKGGSVENVGFIVQGQEGLAVAGG